jgi:hypothetical protein
MVIYILGVWKLGVLFVPIPKTPSCTPSFSWFEFITFNFNPNPSLNFTPSKSRNDGEKSITKIEML